MKNFGLKFMYGLMGNAVACFGLGITNYVPIGDPIVTFLWQGVAVGAGTGLVAAAKRLFTKAGYTTP